MSEKQAVVTGAADGIGRRLALALAKSHIKVFALDKDGDGLASLKALHPDLITTHVCDLKDMDEDKARQIAFMVPQVPGVNFLVHNAAATPATKFGQITRAVTDELFAVNATAPLLLTQAFADHLIQASGRVLHLGTNLAHRGSIGLTSYYLSKCALYSLVRQLRLEFRGKSVSVASCIPGMTNTKAFWAGHEESERLGLPLYGHVENFLKQGNKPNEPEEVAGFLYWILNETTAEEYESKEWDIYDETVTDKWRPYILL